MTVKEFYDAVQANWGCQNDADNIWCTLDGFQANLKMCDVMPNGEKEPFEASYMLDSDSGHWAWEEFCEQYNNR